MPCGEASLGGRDIAESQILGQGFRGHFGLETRSEDRFDLGSEVEATFVTSPEKGFFSEAVAGEKQSLPPRIPKGHGEHPIELLDDTLAPLLVSMDDDFRVGSGAKAVGAHKLTAQALEVVDLAVQNHLDRAIFVWHRLTSSRGQINDREAAMRQNHRARSAGRHLDS